MTTWRQLLSPAPLCHLLRRGNLACGFWGLFWGVRQGLLKAFKGLTRQKSNIVSGFHPSFHIPYCGVPERAKAHGRLFQHLKPARIESWLPSALLTPPFPAPELPPPTPACHSYITQPFYLPLFSLAPARPPRTWSTLQGSCSVWALTVASGCALPHIHNKKPPQFRPWSERVLISFTHQGLTG